MMCGRSRDNSPGLPHPGVDAGLQLSLTPSIQNTHNRATMRWMGPSTSRRASALSSVALLAVSLLATATAGETQRQTVFGTSDDAVFMTSNDKPSLADALTINPELGIFYSYLRESTSLVRGEACVQRA